MNLTLSAYAFAFHNYLSQNEEWVCQLQNSKMIIQNADFKIQLVVICSRFQNSKTITVFFIFMRPYLLDIHLVLNQKNESIQINTLSQNLEWKWNPAIIYMWLYIAVQLDYLDEMAKMIERKDFRKCKHKTNYSMHGQLTVHDGMLNTTGE